MTYTALFLDREQKIRANEFPEKPPTCAEANKGCCWTKGPCPDGKCGLKDHDMATYRIALQSALDTGILCEDQEEANKIIGCAGWRYVEPMKPYRVNYRMEVKEVLVFPVFNSHQPKKKLATLKPI